MIHREIFDLVHRRLSQFDSVALVGPRQVGKTTLARAIAAGVGEKTRYLDLENPSNQKLLDDPDSYFTAYTDHLIILDEVQRMPEIFQVLRGQIDQRRRMEGGTGKFLILGSASIDLLRQSSESLAGRISYVEMTALTFREVMNDDQTRTINRQDPIDGLWLKGGFPESYMRLDEDVSLQWRQDFIQTYLERDIPQFGLQVVTDQLSRFWRMLANDQGELFNAQRFARSLGVSGHTISRYLGILEKLLLVRTLQPWSVNTGKRLVKSPRPFVCDSGILHALLNLRSMDALRSHAVSGKSWEGFVIENLIDACRGRARPHFYRTGAGAEADLVLEFAPGRCWAIEVKLSSAPTVDRGFHNAAEDIGAERRILVYKGQESFPMRGGIEAMPLLDAVNAVSVEVGV
ncbi:MAG: ATP-binding protein [Gammaproteobacteria bacterium]|nr:ATP-binding protein [Gammaproteobacteria bacterium]